MFFFLDLTYPQFVPMLRYMYTGQCEIEIDDIDLVYTACTCSKNYDPMNLYFVLFYECANCMEKQKSGMEV